MTVKCNDFAGLLKVCVGDTVLIRTTREIYRGTVKEISEFGYMIEDPDGFTTVVRYRYITSVKVIERGGQGAQGEAH